MDPEEIYRLPFIWENIRGRRVTSHGAGFLLGYTQLGNGFSDIYRGFCEALQHLTGLRIFELLDRGLEEISTGLDDRPGKSPV